MQVQLCIAREENVYIALYIYIHVGLRDREREVAILTPKTTEFAMVSLSTWFRYIAHQFEYSVALSWKVLHSLFSLSHAFITV